MNRWKRWCVIMLSLLMLLSALPVGANGAVTARKGVDVSRWQGTVDWAKAKKAGVEFAILRCLAYRKDTTFDANYAGATAQGIPLGAYVYMYATTPQGAVKEAQDALAALDGKQLTYPLFLDVEDSSVFALSSEAVTDLMLIELNIFAAAGYRVGLYCSLSHSSTEMDLSRLENCSRWIARWTCYTTDSNPKAYTFASQDPNGSKKPDCEMWQFSNGGKGSTYGMSSDYVDLNYCYVDYVSMGPCVPSTHRWQAQLTERSCTEPGKVVLTCADCGEKQEAAYTLPAYGHTAPDAAGRCTRCGADLTAPQVPPEEPPETPVAPSERVCPLCGTVHRGPFGFVFLLFHTVADYFRKAILRQSA